MTQRAKRSVSLPPDLATAIDEAGAAEGSTFSGWLAETAAQRLLLEEGGRSVASWDAVQELSSAKELADGLARARQFVSS